jgi:hypothetical protein
MIAEPGRPTYAREKRVLITDSFAFKRARVRYSDGSTIPIAMAARLVRRGFSESENSNFVLIVILVAILIALVITLIACLLFYKVSLGRSDVNK